MALNLNDRKTIPYRSHPSLRPSSKRNYHPRANLGIHRHLHLRCRITHHGSTGARPYRGSASRIMVLQGPGHIEVLLSFLCFLCLFVAKSSTILRLQRPCHIEVLSFIKTDKLLVPYHLIWRVVRYRWLVLSPYWRWRWRWF